MIFVRHSRLYLSYLKKRFRHDLAQLRHSGPGRYLKAVMGDFGTDRCLLVYLTDPFLKTDVDMRHQNRWQARELARLASLFGYTVDVMDPGFHRTRVDESYDLVIDLHPGMTPIYEPACHADTRRIAYITGSNPTFSNLAETERISAIEKRHGIRLRRRRQVPIFSQHEFDAYHGFFFIGNQVNLRTYDDYRLPPVHFVRNFAYPVPAVDGSNRSATDFLFLASGGQVHKGLDQLLEVFSKRNDWTLHICSAFHEEPDFCRLFKQTLFNRANIIPHGFLVLDSSRFLDIAAQCSMVVLPSCSEANAGSVLSGVAAGLVPLVSRECGFEPDEVHYFAGTGSNDIERGMDSISSRGGEWLAAEAVRIGGLIGKRYSREAFTGSVQTALATVLADRPNRFRST